MAIVKFVGHDADAITAEHPDVVSEVCRQAPLEDEATLTIHVSPFPDDGEAMEWIAQVVSPQGRQTYEVTQRVRFGAINIRPQVR